MKVQHKKNSNIQITRFLLMLAISVAYDSAISLNTKFFDTVDKRETENQSSQSFEHKIRFFKSLSAVFSVDQIMTNLNILDSQLFISEFMINRSNLNAFDDFVVDVENKVKRKKHQKSKKKSKKTKMTRRKKKVRLKIEETRARNDDSSKSCKNCEKTHWSQNCFNSKFFKLKMQLEVKSKKSKKKKKKSKTVINTFVIVFVIESISKTFTVFDTTTNTIMTDVDASDSSLFVTDFIVGVKRKRVIKTKETDILTTHKKRKKMINLMKSLKRFSLFFKSQSKTSIKRSKRSTKTTRSRSFYSRLKVKLRLMSTKRVSRNKTENVEMSLYVNDIYLYLKLNKELQSASDLIIKIVITVVNVSTNSDHFQFESTRDFDIKSWLIQCKNYDRAQQLIDKKFFIFDHMCKFSFYYVEKVKCYMIDHDEKNDFLLAVTLQNVFSRLQFWMSRQNYGEIRKDKRVIIFFNNSNQHKFEMTLRSMIEYIESFRARFFDVNLVEKTCEICKKTSHFETICFQLLIVIFFELDRSLKCMLKNRSSSTWVTY